MQKMQQEEPKILGKIDRDYMLDNVKRLWAQTVAAASVAQGAQSIANNFLQEYQKYENEVKQYLNIPRETEITIDLSTGEVRLLTKKEEPTDVSKMFKMILPQKQDAT